MDISKEIVLVSQIRIDKWFNLPFILAMADHRLREMGVTLRLIGPPNDFVSERLTKLEIKYVNVENYVSWTERSLPWSEIIKQYDNNLFVCGSNQGFLGTFGEEVISHGFHLICYNIGFEKIESNLMFANNQVELRNNLFDFFAFHDKRDELKMLNTKNSNGLNLCKEDIRKLEFVFGINNEI
jgi:hypothetical protein